VIGAVAMFDGSSEVSVSKQRLVGSDPGDDATQGLESRCHWGLTPLEPGWNESRIAGPVKPVKTPARSGGSPDSG